MRCIDLGMPLSFKQAGAAGQGQEGAHQDVIRKHLNLAQRRRLGRATGVLCSEFVQSGHARDHHDAPTLGRAHISKAHAEGEPVLAEPLALLPAFDDAGDAQPKCRGAGPHTERQERWA